MNIFVLSYDPYQAAEYHCDKHVVKMCLEAVQLLSTVSHVLTGDGPYKLTHKNHPCAIWARAAYKNYSWLYSHADALFQEYSKRYKKHHKSSFAYRKINVPEHRFPRIERTDFALVMPDKYKLGLAVKSYRAYYIGEKAHMAKWNYSQQPDWFTTNG